jgi:hypothetical protein
MLPVRTTNQLPPLRPRAEPAQGSTATNFQFVADGIDPEGDPVTWRWDFGDGSEAQGARVRHAFLSAGTHTVKLNASDGWDSAEATLRVDVAPAPGGGGGTPGPEVGLLLAALALSASRARASRGRR